MKKFHGRTRNAGKNQLRIIGGKWRGRKLSFPDIAGLRPTGDRIRETLFNWLMPEGMDCLDLFAGSAALGLEALSRGAKSVVFVEKNRAAACALADNCELLGASQWQLHHGDALQWLKTPCETPFDIVFIDPPFAEGLVKPAMVLLTDNGYLHEGSRIYLETARNEVVETPPNWQLLKEKVTGQVCYRLYQCV